MLRFGEKVGVCVFIMCFLYIVTLVGCCLIWKVPLEVPWRQEVKKIPPGVFRVMWCVSYCVESKLYFFCAFLTFHVFLWFYLFYTIVCCCNMGRWVVLVLLKFIFNHLYTYAFNSSSANISRCLCECRLYKTCAEIVCVKK